MLAPTVEKPLEVSDVLSMTTNMLQKRKIKIKPELIPGRLKLITPNRIVAIRLRNFCFVCIAFYSIDNELKCLITVTNDNGSSGKLSTMGVVERSINR
ncbi:hypothetical protein ACI65C_005306 [Semiaphis heraclei]